MNDLPPTPRRRFGASNVAFTVALVAGYTAVALLLFFAFKEDLSFFREDRRTVEVVGSASAWLRPTLISIDLSVEETSRASMAEAWAGLARRVDRIRAALVKSGVDLERGVTTRDVGLHTRPLDRRRTRDGPEHIAHLSMTIERPLDRDDTKTTMQMMGLLLDAGATGFRDLSFRADDETLMQARKALERLALEDAFTKATAAAEASSRHLGSPVQIVVGTGSREPLGDDSPVEAMAVSSGAGPGGLSTGRGARLSVTVRAIYGLGDPRPEYPPPSFSSPSLPADARSGGNDWILPTEDSPAPRQ